MPSMKKEIPYAWFWFGKPLHKGHSRGERIRPVYVNRDGELLISRRSSRASLSAEKSRRPCELHQDQTRAPSPSRSERVNSPKKFCGMCSPVESESEAATQGKLPCSCCHKAPSPLHRHPLAATPTSSRTATPAPCYCYVCQVGGAKTVLPVHHEHAHGYQIPIPTPSPQVPQAETARGKGPQGKCPCCQSTAPAEPETRRHTCLYSEDCHGECYFVDVGSADDTVSETSVEVNSESDRGEECECGHFIFAFPCAAH